MSADPQGPASGEVGPARSVPPGAMLQPGTVGAATPAAVASGPLRRARLAWRHWRRSRPFWGSVLIVLGAGEILLSERAPLRAIVHFGAQGLAGYLVPVIMMLCGVMLLVSPQQRTFYSILAILMSLGSWLTANLGGFFVGLLLGLVGGSLAFAWAPRRAGEATVPGQGGSDPAGSRDESGVAPAQG